MGNYGRDDRTQKGEKWDVKKEGPLIQLDENKLKNTPFSFEIKQFLTVSGLPETPPPYLEFTALAESLQPMNQKFNLPEKYQEFWYLGSTGDGYPICLQEKSEIIIYLNYDQSDKEVFINSSIHQFAECLLLYVEMIDKAIEVIGEDAYIDNDIPVSILAELKNQFHRVDPR